MSPAPLALIPHVLAATADVNNFTAATLSLGRETH